MISWDKDSFLYFRLSFFGFVAGLLSMSCSGMARDLPPNILFIVADDLGYGELSCQNPQTDIPTPNIDNIGRDGIRFTNSYVTAAYCAASRAGFLTGRYQTRFGFEFNPIGPRNEDPDAGLPEKEKTLADLLRDQAGYSTMLVGKWHLGGTARFNPIRRGFDDFFGFLHEGHYFRPHPYDGMTTWLRRRSLPGGGKGLWSSPEGRLHFSTHMGNNEPDYDADNPIYRNGQPVVVSENLTDAFTSEAISFMERCGKERPFFLYLSYNAVHSPLQGDDAYMERYSAIPDLQRRIFAAMLGQLDDNVGRLLTALERLDLAADTWVVFFSDNGGPTRELTSSNLPLRGEKGQLYEGGIRVPFLMQMPGTLPRGATENRMISSLDLFPTALRLARLEPGPSLDGKDLMPFLNGKENGPIHERLFWRVGKQAALRSGDFKLVRTGHRDQAGPWQLYDLSSDISESQDLAAERPEVLQDLIRPWEALDGEMVDPVF